jgi:hypothetical protein
MSRRRTYTEALLDDLAVSPRKTAIRMPSGQVFVEGEQVAYVGKPTTIKSDNVVTVTNGRLTLARIRDFVQFHTHEVHARLDNGDAVELSLLVRTDQKHR